MNEPSSVPPPSSWFEENAPQNPGLIPPWVLAGFLTHQEWTEAGSPAPGAPGSRPRVPGVTGEADRFAPTSPVHMTTPIAGQQGGGRTYDRAPAGFDQEKWMNVGHTSPKYVISRIIGKYGHSPDGLRAALPEIQALFPGTTIKGNDVLDFGPNQYEGSPLGQIDVIRDVGGANGPQWEVTGGAPGPVAAPSPASGPSDSLSSLATQGGPARLMPGDPGYNPDLDPSGNGHPNPAYGGGGFQASNSPNYNINAGMSTGSLLEPWDQSFSYQPFQPQAPKAPGYQAFVAPEAKAPNYAAFQRPTADTMQLDPGYAFRLAEGEKGINRAASARGTFGTGGTIKELLRYGQDYASGEYDKVYGRDLGEWTAGYNRLSAEDANAYNRANQDWTTGYNRLAGEDTNAFNRDLSAWTTGYNKDLGEYTLAQNTFYANQDRPFNKLSSLAGVGQVAANQLGANSLNYSQLYGNVLGQGMGAYNDLNLQGANAGAAGTIGGANAWSNALGNVGNLAQLAYLQRGTGYR